MSRRCKNELMVYRSTVHRTGEDFEIWYGIVETNPPGGNKFQEVLIMNRSIELMQIWMNTDCSGRNLKIKKIAVRTAWAIEDDEVDPQPDWVQNE